MNLADLQSSGSYEILDSEVLGEQICIASDNAPVVPSIPTYRVREMRLLQGLPAEDLRRVHEIKVAFKGEVFEGRPASDIDMARSYWGGEHGESGVRFFDFLSRAWGPCFREDYSAALELCDGHHGQATSRLAWIMQALSEGRVVSLVAGTPGVQRKAVELLCKFGALGEPRGKLVENLDRLWAEAMDQKEGVLSLW